MHIAAALAAYETQLAADGRAPGTREQARRYVTMLAAWLEAHVGPTRLAAITPEHVARFLASPAVERRADGRPRRVSSANTLRSVVKGFFAFAAEAGYVPRSPARLVRLARGGSGPPRGLPDADRDRLLARLARRDDALGRRDFVLFSMMLATGIRVGNAVALRIEDLDLQQGYVHLPRVKGGGAARAVLPPKTVTMLRGYIGNRRRGVLFETTRGRPMTVRQARRRLGQALSAAGVERSYSPHALRHAFATTLLANGNSLRLVQVALGHRDPGTTAKYTTVEEAALRRALAS